MTVALIHPDAIADCVLAAFHALPAKCKPRHMAGGRREWVPLAGIVLSRGTENLASANEESRRLPVRASRVDDTAPALRCAALATGMKCLPQSKVPLGKGNVLHDWHAEILAIRAFNRWLVDECAELARQGLSGEDGEGKMDGEVSSEGAWVRWRRDSEGGWNAHKHHLTTEDGGDTGGQEAEQEHILTPPFALHDDVQIHMYCSEAPCGDASMELTMAEQADATPWTRPPAEDGMLGRGNFDQLGVVRRKPARPDAPPTASKSCSDKLAMKQCTGLFSGVTSLLVYPGKAYLRTLVLPEERCVREGVERAFGVEGRMKGVLEGEVLRQWGRAGYEFKPFEVRTTGKVFEYAKTPLALASGPGGDVTEPISPIPSNISALYTARRLEVLINGVLQGRRQQDPKGASCVSRRRMWEAVRGVADSAGMLLPELTPGASYADLKGSPMLEAREAVKKRVKEKALKGWKRNVGDEGWRLV